MSFSKKNLEKRAISQLEHRWCSRISSLAVCMRSWFNSQDYAHFWVTFCSQMYRHIPGCTGTREYILVYLSMCRNILRNTIISKYILISHYMTVFTATYMYINGHTNMSLVYTSKSSYWQTKHWLVHIASYTDICWAVNLVVFHARVHWDIYPDLPLKRRHIRWSALWGNWASMSDT